MSYFFFYGTNERYIDITNEVYNYCFYGNHIFIPQDDILRGVIFPDPLYGKVKNILVVKIDGLERNCRVYSDKEDINIQINNFVSSSLSIRKEVVERNIGQIHSKLRLVDGNMRDEYNEQMMVLNYLDSKAKVLEIGANIGRNTMMISSVLEDERNLVTLECDPYSVNSLRKNRFINKFRFNIEPSALSYRKLIQKGWDTIPSDILIPGYKWVSCITFEQLIEKYGIDFDTLVLDCEGAIYYILMDNPNILNKIKMIILESDYHTVEHKRYVELLFEKNGLEKVYSEGLIGYEHLPFPKECRESFYEVWKK